MAIPTGRKTTTVKVVIIMRIMTAEARKMVISLTSVSSSSLYLYDLKRENIITNNVLFNVTNFSIKKHLFKKHFPLFVAISAYLRFSSMTTFRLDGQRRFFCKESWSSSSTWLFLLTHESRSGSI